MTPAEMTPAELAVDILATLADLGELEAPPPLINWYAMGDEALSETGWHTMMLREHPAAHYAHNFHRSRRRELLADMVRPDPSAAGLRRASEMSGVPLPTLRATRKALGLIKAAVDWRGRWDRARRALGTGGWHGIPALADAMGTTTMQAIRMVESGRVPEWVRTQRSTRGTQQVSWRVGFTK